MTMSEMAATRPTYGSLEAPKYGGALTVSQSREAPEAARLGRLAVPPLVTGGGAVSAFVLFALPRAYIDRLVAACNVSVAHVLHRLQQEH